MYIEKKTKKISLVIPLYNEEENLFLFHKQLRKALEVIEEYFEIIFVDDGSKDKTYERLSEIYQSNDWVKVIRLSKNFGQRAALAAGINFSKGDVVITMDGDLQHDPKDIPRFLEKIEQGYDLVCSWRKKRTDNLFSRKFPSALANILLRSMLKTDLHDFGSNYRAYGRRAIGAIRLYSKMHGFIPALVNNKDISVCEIPISSTNRIFGKSKYSLPKIICLTFGLLITKIFDSFSNRQLQILRIIGIFLLVFGLFSLLNIDRQFHLLFALSILSTFIGFIKLFCLSFYSGVKYKPFYHIKEIKSCKGVRRL